MERGGSRLTAVILSVLMLSAACNTVSGSGNVVTRQIDAPTFSTLEVSDGFTVSVAIGSSQTVTVRVDDNLVDILDVGVSDDTLQIGLESRTDVTDATLEADVTVVSLAVLQASGASTVTLVDPIEVAMLTVGLSGASEVTGAIQIDGGSLELSGASRASLSGSATTLGVTASGASRLDGRDLTIDELTIDVSGASNAEVTVTGSLSAVASGASMVHYAGSPTVARSDESGASTIEPIS
jgi:Putative auto-transporter adhesin, head GIN domain